MDTTEAEWEQWPPTKVCAWFRFVRSASQAVEALRISPSQERFVSTVAESLREAAAEPDGRALFWDPADALEAVDLLVAIHTREGTLLRHPRYHRLVVLRNRLRR